MPRNMHAINTLHDEKRGRLWLTAARMARTATATANSDGFSGMAWQSETPTMIGTATARMGSRGRISEADGVGTDAGRGSTGWEGNGSDSKNQLMEKAQAGADSSGTGFQPV